MNRTPQTKAYLIGGGIAGLSSAVFLIRDAGLPGKNICILEEGGSMGGSLDAAGNPDSGYIMRGGRMFEEHFECTYDMLSEIPSYDDEKISASEDIRNFYKEASWRSSTRLIDKEGKVVDVSTMGFDNGDRMALTKLMLEPESMLGIKTIRDVFPSHFFTSNFWYMWCSMFAFEPWHSAVEMRRYLLRFIHVFPQIADMTCIWHTRYNQYHSMVVPVQRWLEKQGVAFEKGVRVTDLEISPKGNQQRVAAIKALRDGVAETMPLRDQDIVIFTNGSMTSASTLGGMHSPAPLHRGTPGGSWELWRTLSAKSPDFGNPEPFTVDVDKSKWLSFTATTTDPFFKKHFEEWTGIELGRGGLITFKDSSWLMTVNLHHNPVYPGQPEGSYIWWGYGLNPDAIGDYVKKRMADCTGEELVTEALMHLGLKEHLPQMLASTKAIPCMMPYITSQFMPRAPGDRPAVVPASSYNLAFVGQYCELPEDTVFTVEYSVRAAKVAVTELMGLEKKVPPVYHGKYNPAVLMRAMAQTLK
jgi:oleate hydratase